jgi:peptidoglycan/LPS O-acetylase OafA/YrhL
MGNRLGRHPGYHRVPALVKRSTAIDALRGACIIAVVGFHYFSCKPMPFPGFPHLAWLFRDGYLGVDLFFAISGYLLGGQLLDGAVGLGEFYLRRAARILPLYLILLVVATIAVPGTVGLAHLTFTQNIAWAFGVKQADYALTGPTWSLAIEEQFYLLLPALILLAPRRTLPAVLFGFALGSLIDRASSTGAMAYYLLPCRADALILGVALALRQRTAPLPSICLPRCRALERIGQLSYAIYLFHVPVGDGAMIVLGPNALGAAAGIVGTIGVALALHVLVEKPVHNWAKSRNRHAGRGWAYVASSSTRD